jgi:hypothetical protein
MMQSTLIGWRLIAGTRAVLATAPIALQMVIADRMLAVFAEAALVALVPLLLERV